MGAIDLVPKDGDGDDFIPMFNVYIETVENGYILTWSNNDEDVREVYTNKKVLLKRLEEIL